MLANYRHNELATELLQIDDFHFADEDFGFGRLCINDGSDDDDDFIKMNNPLYETQIDKLPDPTQYTVSTMTIITGFNSRMDLELIYEKMDCDSIIPGILNIRFRDNPPKGAYAFKKRNRKNSKSRKIFLNQMTFDVLPAEGRRISVKLFKDGKMQLAGCKTYDEAGVATNILMQKLQKIRTVSRDGDICLKMTDEQHEHLLRRSTHLNDEQWRDELHDIKALKLKASYVSKLPEFELPFTRQAVEASHDLLIMPPEIVMINSDFDSKVPLDKNLLRNLLQHKYGLFCQPASSRYPGINSKRVSSASCTFGCESGSVESWACAMQTKKKKRKNGCCTVSLLIFQPGKIIMTGARSLAQLDDTYDFITEVFRKDYSLFQTNVLP